MAWSELATILRRNGLAPDAPPWIALAEAITAGGGTYQNAIAAIIASIEAQGNSTAVLRVLCGEQHPEARGLALELAGRLPALDSILVPWLRPLLRDRRLPRDARIAAAATLLRTTGPRGGAAARVVRDFAAGFGRLRVLSRQSDLRRRFGNARAFDRLCARLRRNIPLQCPRCGERRRPASMIRHLWQRHGRLLARRRVRSPMSWLDDWAANASPSADPDDGLAHLTRQLRRRRLASPDAAPSLRIIAARHDANLCPHCHAFVTLPVDEYPKTASLPELELYAGRLTGEGFVVRRITHRIGARIEITTPSGTREILPDPHGRWNRAVAVRRLVLPWIVLAIGWAWLLPAHLAILGTALALSAAYGFRLLVRSQSAPATSGSLINAAWTNTVPMLLDTPLSARSSRYIGRLAATSVHRGSVSARAGPLAIAERRIKSALNQGAAVADEWAALVGLRIADLDRIGDNPVPGFADMVIQAMRDEAPLARLELLMAHTPWRDWPIARRTRLRVALAARAFEFGLGVWELVELGEVIPSIAEVLNTSDVDGLARLRLLWILRQERPWERCGSAATVFELAAYPTTESELAAAPDVLLYWTWNDLGRPERVWITGRGLIFRDAKLSAPGPIEVHLRPAGRGYELHYGSARFRYSDDPTRLADALSEWSNYLFKEFLPQTDSALGKPDGTKLEILLRSKTLVCPECGILFRGLRLVDAP
jgi:uncharacterized C2H2 Zn-finger protein